MSDESLHVRFSLEARIDEHATQAEGANVWRNVEYITIHIPGDKTNIVHRPVEDKDRRRFAKQYEAWKRGQGQVQEGQPLKEWAAITPAEVQMLAQANVYTVEQLAEVSDANAPHIGPILALRDKARRHVAQSKSSAPLEALAAKLEQLERALAAKDEQLAELHGLLSSATAPSPPPPEVAPPPSEERPRSARRGRGDAQMEVL